MPTAAPPTMPVVQLGDLAIADLQLVLDGVRLPWLLLGGALTGRAGDMGRPDEVDDDVVDVLLPAEVGAPGAGSGVLLADRERTPLARVEPTGDPASVPAAVRGRVLAERRREARPFGELARTAAQVRRDLVLGNGANVLLAARPAMLGELGERRAEDGGQGVVLVPTETATPDGVPPAVLMRAIQAAAAEESPSTVPVPVALHWRDPASDAALIAAVLAAYGGEPGEVMGAGGLWRNYSDALLAGVKLPPGRVGPGVAAVLEDWRPPRHRRGLVVLLTGLSGSGKSTLARDLADHVRARAERTVSLLDGDDVRRLLSAGLGFDRPSRELNVRRIGYVAAEVARHGGMAVCAPIAPYAATRDEVRRMVGPVGDFVLVHVSTPLAECERRDLKGLYARARAGEIAEFTGISDPYDVPTDADLSVDTSTTTRTQALDQLLTHLSDGGWLPSRRTP
jgi:sulfate adenylyltransferase